MESSLLHFLRQRNIGEALISELEKDKIDTAVIPLMSDHDLEKYVPQFGDRVALVAFCRRNQPANNKAIDRKHLLEKEATIEHPLVSNLTKKLDPVLYTFFPNAEPVLRVHTNCCIT
uniref:Uncharacterized protein n=1 Tax=Knipowitschia caucasica TaxID=637954 RepID=A0AAV2KGL7_KNICA